MLSRLLGEVIALIMSPTAAHIISPSPPTHMSPPAVWMSVRAAGAQPGWRAIITGNGSYVVCRSTMPTRVSGTIAISSSTKRAM